MENRFLAHHGIDGQKWYHRNGPPYPLDSEDRSAAEKKAAEGGPGSWKAKRDIKKDDAAIAKEKKKAEEAERKKVYDENTEKLKVLSKRSAAKEARYMTDAELKAAIDRLKAEESYIGLRSNSISDGKDWVEKAAANAMTLGLNQLFQEMAKDATLGSYKAIKKIIEKEIKDNK